MYLVGGTVRDLLLGDEAKPLDQMDFDATTTATPQETKKLVADLADAVWTQGERFGTIGLRMGDRVYEITTHRAEAYSPDSRKPEVQFAGDIETDLSRRDFTFNAMALELTGDAPVLVDPFGGAADLMTRTLRTPLSPEESFSDDPLRMMRAARFVAQLQVAPDPALAVEGRTARLERDRDDRGEQDRRGDDQPGGGREQVEGAAQHQRVPSGGAQPAGVPWRRWSQSPAAIDAVVRT